MKKLSFSLVVVLVLAILCSYSFADNGAPSGAHYNLNIIGVQKDKTADMTDQNGHVIFVALDGKTKINLTEAEDDTFAVLDKNGTDSDGATFQLPNPDPDNDGTTVYSVFVRALGKPGGEAIITPGAEFFDGEDWIEVTSELEVTASRHPGKSTFENVSRELLYVYVDIGDGIRRYPLFSEEMQNYFWDYDNAGLKHLQMRFYEIPTTIESPYPAP